MPTPTLAVSGTKPSRQEYDRWLRRTFRSREVRRGRLEYDSIALTMRDRFEKSDFWRGVTARLSDWTAAYNVGRGEVLLGEAPGGLLLKSWESFSDKTYRRNVALNEDWPGPPAGRWLVPPDSYSMITDIVRTMFVARYLDGVRFLSNQLVTLADELSVPSVLDLQAKPEGYYAAQIVVRIPMDLPVSDLGLNPFSVGVEIQITTQIQELLRKLLHRQYEQERMSPPDDSWRWRWESPQFALGYLGHILHYVEGRMVNLRDAEPNEDEPDDVT